MLDDILKRLKKSIRQERKNALIAQGYTNRQAKDLTNKLEVRHEMEDEAYEEYEELVAWLINEFKNRSGTN